MFQCVSSQEYRHSDRKETNNSLCLFKHEKWYTCHAINQLANFQTASIRGPRTFFIRYQEKTSPMKIKDYIDVVDTSGNTHITYHLQNKFDLKMYMKNFSILTVCKIKNYRFPLV